jgi:drug/metabolite transporter (DMT)-like permease
MGFKILKKNKKYIRLVAGIIIGLFGAVFMLVPFIPLGYVFIIASLLLLSTYIPPLKRLIDKIRKKDDKNRVEDVEEKIDEGEEAVSEKIVEGEDKKEE